MGNEMTYNGNHIFHYTTFDAAIKIIASGRLRFNPFKNMNDIAEVKRDYYVNCDLSIVEDLLSEYKSISLTTDTGFCDRGFAIDALWGYYAEKGNGACLIFDKTKLIEKYRSGYACKGIPKSLNISYLDNFTNSLNFEGSSPDMIKEEIQHNIQDIFYTKDCCWSHEKEVRLLTIDANYLPIETSLLGVILCLPKASNCESTEEYNIMNNLRAIRDFNILTSFCNLFLFI